MVVEDTQKSSITDDQITGNPSAPNNNNNDNHDNELEEGEILDDDDDSATSKPPSAAAAGNPHPLENSWTFWFDNPSVKSKQAAWGSSIRPIYTFATVEEFWRYPSFFYPFPPFGHNQNRIFR